MPDERYWLVAFAPGSYVMNQHDLRAVATGEDVLIEMGAVYAAVLDVRLDDTTINPAFTLLSKRSPRGVSPLDQDLLADQFPALNETTSSSGGVFKRIPLFYAADQETPTVGPVRVGVSVLGCQPATMEVNVPRLGEDVPSFELRVPVEVDDTSTLQIQVLGGAPRTQPASGATYKKSCSVVLEQRGAPEGQQAQWFHGLDEWPRYGDVIVVPGVPHGTYALSLRSGHGLYSCRTVEHSTGAVDTHVDVDGDVAVTMTPPDLGCIVVTLQDDEGEYEGSASIKLTDDSGASGYVAFREAPYVIGGLVSGRYRLSATYPLVGGGRAQGNAVRVAPGGIASVTLENP